MTRWWTKSWNPVIGCTPCSPACDNCYAEALHTQRHKAKLAGAPMPLCYAEPFGKVRFLSERLSQPLHWRKPQRIFVGNMGDLFHDAVVSFAFLDRIFATMARCPQHTFMLLTKRPELMHEYLTFNNRFENVWMCAKPNRIAHIWPLPNVWIGTTIWDQPSADRAVPILLNTPAAKRFVSVEPMLGPVDLTAVPRCEVQADLGEELLHWVICGGETGKNARPMHPDWPRSLRDQCQGADMPFFFKQWGGWAPGDEDGEHSAIYLTRDGQDLFGMEEEDFARHYGGAAIMLRLGTRKAGRVLDGQEWSEVPHG